jgi:hypothetical protein
MCKTGTKITKIFKNIFLEIKSNSYCLRPQLTKRKSRIDLHKRTTVQSSSIFSDA